MKFFVKIFLLTFIIAGVVLAFNNHLVRNQLSTTFNQFSGNVKGVNTKRAEGITSQLTEDIHHQVDYVKEQAMNVKIVDVLYFFDRTRKVANDFKSMQDYVKEQTKNFKIGSRSGEKKSATK